MAARLERLVATLALMGATGCGARAPEAPVKAPAAPAATVSPEQSRALSGLRARLAEVRDPGDPLATLPADMRKAGLALIGKLSPAEDKQLLSADGEMSKKHPVFHLLAGGREQVVLTRLRREGVNDLLSLWQASGHGELDALLPIVREVSVRGAKHWLALTSAKLRSDKDVDVALCDQIELVSTSIGLLELGRSAVEMAASLEPSAERWLKVANAAAMGKDVARARDAIARAKRSEWKKSTPLPVADSEARLQNAELASVAVSASSSPEALLKKARALAALGLPREVIALLGARPESVRAHAGLAASLAKATLDDFVDRNCPTSAASALLQVCFVSAAADPTMKRALDFEREAWANKQGRDATAAEIYVGMVFVLPLARGFLELGKGTSEQVMSEVTSGIVGLDGALAEAERVAPALEGLHLYTQALRRVFEMKRVTGLWPSPAERLDFEAHAADVAKRHGREPWGQAGVTFAAALLAFGADSAPLFAALPDDIDPVLRLPRAWIRLWSAVVQKDPPSIQRAVAELTQVMPSEAADPIARGSAILLMAEVEAATTGNAADYKQLGEVAQKLTVPGWPTAVRVRAAIDLAGVANRDGDGARAVELLRAIPQSELTAAEDIGEIAKAYLLVLEASQARGEARKPFIAELAKLGQDDALNVLGVWRELWVKELTFLEKLDRCGKDQACVKRAAKDRRPSDAEIEKRLGRWLSQLVKNGILSHGTFRSGIGYATGSGMFGTVDFSFELPAVEYPEN